MTRISPVTTTKTDIGPSVEAQKKQSEDSSFYKKCFAAVASIFILSSSVISYTAWRWKASNEPEPLPLSTTTDSTTNPMPTTPLIDPLRFSANCTSDYQLPPLVNMPQCETDSPPSLLGENCDMVQVMGEALKMSEEERARVMENIKIYGQIVNDLNAFAKTCRCEEIKAKEAALIHLRNTIQTSQDTCWKLSRYRMGIQHQINNMLSVGKGPDGRMLMLTPPTSKNDLDTFVTKIKEAGFQQDCQANTSDCVNVFPDNTPIKSITLMDVPSMPLLAPFQGQKDLHFFTSLNLDNLREAVAKSREQIEKTYKDLLDETNSSANSTMAIATKAVDSVSMKLSRRIISMFNSTFAKR